ncbi:MAG: DUF58 domain-containing protein [Opitutaceae bacterium]|nr:DUF58 domain-containing protein [Cytophagales bacterium]
MNILEQELKKIGHFEFLAKQTVDGFITGLHKSPYHGFSVEFSEHKQYSTGDSIRFVDWKVFAKTDKLYIKKFEEETNLRCRILLDVSSSMYYPVENNGKIRFSSFAGACIAYLLQKQRDAFGVSFFDEKVGFQSQVKSTSAHLSMLFGELEKISDQKGQNINLKSHVTEAIHALAESIHRRSLVVIFSDMMDNSSEQENILNALLHLKHNKHEVLIFHVYDSKTELNLDFEDRPIEFVDIETGEKVKLVTQEIKDQYRKKIEESSREIMIRCAQFKIDYVRADINEGVEKILESYLVKRNKMS